MIDTIRTWLMGIVIASLAVSLAVALVPPGTLRRVLSVTGGLILLLVVLQPLLRVDLKEVKLDTSQYQKSVENRRAELKNADNEQMAKLIAEKMESYILDKAKQLGISCTVEVTTKTGEDGVPYPSSAALSCPPSEELAAYLEQELGISRERQSWNGTETGT